MKKNLGFPLAASGTPFALPFSEFIGSLPQQIAKKAAANFLQKCINSVLRMWKY
jgi:hypothetical protein